MFVFCTVEFPAVLLDVVTGSVLSEFHHYVQPQEQPCLSTFCTGLTGITQVVFLSLLLCVFVLISRSFYNETTFEKTVFWYTRLW